ncbi:MAG: hypothetical protein ACFFEN_13255 [Candidatus Thorarchaeota archaeon]
MVSLPAFWILGLIAFFVRSVLGLYNINQPPILQEINLLEAQGKISSANQFLESIGSGTGPIKAGSVLLFFNQKLSNYSIYHSYFGYHWWTPMVVCFEMDK